MYGASLAKTAFACMVLQLVDEGRLKLDTTLPELLPRWAGSRTGRGDVSGRNRARLVQARSQRLDRQHGCVPRDETALRGHAGQ